VVSVVIINYNTFQITCNCIQSIQAYTHVPYEIILVDNASTECNPDLFKEKFPFVKLIKNPVNNGFAAGNNLGIEATAGSVILLLNSDTYLAEPSIDKSVQYLNDHPECGVLGCRMTFPDGRVQYTARRFRSLLWEILDIFRPILLLLPYQKRAQMMLGKYFKGDFNTECDWLNGAFFMMRKEIVKKLSNGKLDDRFFMYGEDQLWCWQILQLGFRNMFFSDTSIIHINNASTEPPKRLALRNIMLRHEIEIMQIRLGKSLNFTLTSTIYKLKENFRNAIKKIIWQLTGRLLR
jgi:GT2 family glycosyltransferase